ncbi:hypothetical protein [Parashewanella spongiae]|uniref:hypothetical protein n=1 Tax=Parashewanella spongiae TaxID=342950 RepID=UPI001059BF8E|nr:hypothetical protein [Parashewanella spongiae]
MASSFVSASASITPYMRSTPPSDIYIGKEDGFPLALALQEAIKNKNLRELTIFCQLLVQKGCLDKKALCKIHEFSEKPSSLAVMLCSRRKMLNMSILLEALANSGLMSNKVNFTQLFLAKKASFVSTLTDLVAEPISISGYQTQIVQRLKSINEEPEALNLLAMGLKLMPVHHQSLESIVESWLQEPTASLKHLDAVLTLIGQTELATRMREINEKATEDSFQSQQCHFFKPCAFIGVQKTATVTRHDEAANINSSHGQNMANFKASIELLDIKSASAICVAIKEISPNNLEELGVYLGLSLSRVQSLNGNLMNLICYWLNGADQVLTESSWPSWGSLVQVLQELDENVIAKSISEAHPYIVGASTPIINMQSTANSQKLSTGAHSAIVRLLSDLLPEDFLELGGELGIASSSLAVERRVLNYHVIQCWLDSIDSVSKYCKYPCYNVLVEALLNLGLNGTAYKIAAKHPSVPNAELVHLTPPLDIGFDDEIDYSSIELSEPEKADIQTEMARALTTSDHYEVFKPIFELDLEGFMALSMALGVNHTRISRLDLQHRKLEIINSWIMKSDNVSKISGEPTYNSLVSKLTEIRQLGYAKKIENSVIKGVVTKRENVSSNKNTNHFEAESKILTTVDLSNILVYLNSLDEGKALLLGISLGVKYSTMRRVYRAEVIKVVIETWIVGEDNTRIKGAANYKTLMEKLREIGEHGLADSLEVDIKNDLLQVGVCGIIPSTSSLEPISVDVSTCVIQTCEIHWVAFYLSGLSLAELGELAGQLELAPHYTRDYDSHKKLYVELMISDWLVDEFNEINNTQTWAQLCLALTNIGKTGCAKEIARTHGKDEYQSHATHQLPTFECVKPESTMWNNDLSDLIDDIAIKQIFADFADFAELFMSDLVKIASCCKLFFRGSQIDMSIRDLLLLDIDQLQDAVINGITLKQFYNALKFTNHTGLALKVNEYVRNS